MIHQIEDNQPEPMPQIAQLAIAHSKYSNGTRRYFYALGFSTTTEVNHDSFGAVLCYKTNDIDGSPDSLAFYPYPSVRSLEECFADVVRRWEGTDDILDVQSWTTKVGPHPLQILQDIENLGFERDALRLLCSIASSPSAVQLGLYDGDHAVRCVLCSEQNNLIARYRMHKPTKSSGASFHNGVPTVTFTRLNCIVAKGQYPSVEQLRPVAEKWLSTPNFVTFIMTYDPGNPAFKPFMSVVPWWSALVTVLDCLIRDGKIKPRPTDPEL